MNRTVKINAAEGIFVPLFDMNIIKTNELYVRGAVMKINWDGYMIRSEKPNFSFEWRGEADISGYDRILIFLNCPSYVKMSARAVTDAGDFELFCGIYGDRFPVEVGGKVDGTVVKAVHIDFEADGGFDTHMVNFSWIGALNSENEHMIEDNLPVYDESSWSAYINRKSRAKAWGRLMFSESELEDMKKRFAEPLYKNMSASLKKEAICLAKQTPEKTIREYIPVSEHLYRYVRVRDRNRKPYAAQALTLAMAGYFFDEPEWSYMAARLIMCAVHTPKWFEGPQCCMEGSTWHHVCFMEEHYSYNISLALMFLGGIFTESGLAVIADKLGSVWKTIEKCCKEQGYRHFMNQGIVENSGCLISACCIYALGKEEYAVKIDECIQRHNEIVNHYINSEGHTTEGGDYYQYSFIRSVVMWLTYANFKNTDVSSIIPKSVKESVKYIECILRKDYTKGEFIPINCSRNTVLSGILISFFASVFSWQKGIEIMKNKMSENDESGINIPLSIKYIRENGKIQNSDYEKCIIMEKSGLASYETENSKFWFAAERNPMTGHYHNDRGSVILEAFGQYLLADPGTTDYSNMMSAYMSSEMYHNTAHPIGESMKITSDIGEKSAREAGVGCTTVVCESDFEKPSAKIKYIRQEENSLSFCAELEDLYSENVISAKRAGRFCEGLLILEDSWEFKNPEAVEICFIAAGEWSINGKTALCTVKDVVMSAEFLSDAEFSLFADKQMVSYDNTKLSVLRVVSKEQRSVRVMTRLEYCKREFYQNENI